MQAEPTLEDAVTWAYRLMLRREPESSDVVTVHVAALDVRTVDGVRRKIAESAEYNQLNAVRIHPELPSLSQFFDPKEREAEQGYFIDAIGVRTRMSYLPPIFGRFSGRRSRDVGLELLPFADHIEVLGMLEAAQSARGRFALMELGAGWGPWVAMGAAIARNAGLDYRVIAIEGSDAHFEFLLTHLADNDVDPAKSRPMHGVVGDSDGVTRFPKLLAPSLDYGASLDRAEPTTMFEEVPSWRVDTLLQDEPILDILHCDIQGHEFVALSASIEAINARVRRIVVGTHGRVIEEHLHQLFSSNGWSIAGDLACRFTPGASPTLEADGAQYWVNSRTL